MVNDRYTVTVEVEVMVRDKSLVVHEPGAVASGVRAHLIATLATNYTKMGIKFNTTSIYAEAKEALNNGHDSRRNDREIRGAA